MTKQQKKVHYGIETALREVSRDEWPTSPKVSTALLKCPRLRGMVETRMKSRGVSVSYQDDIVSEVARVMQMKMMAQLDAVESVYFVVYRVIQLVTSNYGKKSVNTVHSEEVSLASFMKEGDDDETAVLERLTSDSALDDDAKRAERQIDLDNAKRRFAEKLAKVGWPEEIKRERTRLGRPPKQNPIVPASS